MGEHWSRNGHRPFVGYIDGEDQRLSQGRSGNYVIVRNETYSDPDTFSRTPHRFPFAANGSKRRGPFDVQVVRLGWERGEQNHIGGLKLASKLQGVPRRERESVHTGVRCR